MKTLLLSALLILSSMLSYSQSYYIVFASNLECSGGVHREDASGADIYCLKYNSSTKTISELTRLTTDTTAVEWFPSLSPDSKWIAYNHTKNNVHEIRLVNRTTKEITTIYTGARYPEWMDNSRLLVSNQKPGKKGIYQLDLDLSGTKPALLTEKMITDTIKCPGTSEQSDAYPFPGYSKILFHSIKSGQYVSAVSVINTDGTGFENLSNWEGVGHSIVNSTGDEIVFASANSGIPVIMTLATKARLNLSLPKTGAEMTTYGNPFPGYPTVHWTYPAWGISNHSLILSAQAANSSGSYEKSRIYMTVFDDSWKNPVITDLSTLIETSYGKTGKEFCTASIRQISEPSTLPPVIYVNIVSHNVNYEDNSSYVNYMVDTATLWKQRSEIIEFAKMCKEEGVKWNFETDWTFLMALDQHDKPMASSNNKKLLKYLIEDIGFEVDACLHGSKYNLGDMAYLFNKQGVTNNITVGGFLASPPDSFMFDSFKNGITSTLDPAFKWYPKILHAPATYKHINEEQIKFSGVWKPKSKTEFTTHDNNGPLVCVSIYNGELDGIRDLLVKQENNQLTPGEIYTATLFLTQNSLNVESYRSTFRSFSRYTSTGKMKWVGVRELAEIWQSQYNSEPNQYLYESNMPYLTTDSAGNISSSGATLKCWCMPNNNNISLGFEYGTTTSLGSSIDGVPSTASGRTPFNYSAVLAGLSPNTKYYYRAKVVSGTRSFPGLIADFTTSSINLVAPTLITPNDNQLNASLKPAFSWNTVTGATSYNLQVSTALNNWTNPLVNLTNISGTSMTLGTSLAVSTSYFWRVQGVSGSVSGPWSAIRKLTTTAVNSIDKLNKRIPTKYELSQNYPNPFNPETNIVFGIPKNSNVKLSVYNSLGQFVDLLLEKPLEAGEYSISWSGQNFPSGIYFLKLEAGDFRAVQKMILMK